MFLFIQFNLKHLLISDNVFHMVLVVQQSKMKYEILGTLTQENKTFNINIRG